MSVGRVTSATVVLLLLLLVGTISYKALRHGGSSTPAASGTAQPPDVRTATFQAQATVIAGFGLASFHTITDAEAEAGYRIPVPSSTYHMAFDQTGLRMNSRGRRLSTTEYVVPGASDSIGLDVGPADYWNDGALTTGTRATIGGKDGWLLRNDSVGIAFAFQCGTVDNVGLWCLVRAPADRVGRNAFDEFVRTIA